MGKLCLEKQLEDSENSSSRQIGEKSPNTDKETAPALLVMTTTAETSLAFAKSSPILPTLAFPVYT